MRAPKGGRQLSSLVRRIRDLEAQIAELQQGGYPQATPLGPGRISGAQIKAKSIIGNHLNVSDLESVATNTGTLTVSGPLTAGTGATTMAYDPANGLYIGASAFGSAPFRVAPSGAMVANSADVSGTITTAALSATGGTIGTFGITPADGMAQGTGSSTRGISTGTTTFYAGAATPGSAPFRVDRFGNAVMSNATISGSSTFSGSLSGASGTFSGSLSGATGSFAGSLSAATGSLGALTIGGALSFGGSGSITLPGGGTLTNGTLDINSASFSGITVDGSVTVGTGGNIRCGQTAYATGTGWFLEYNSGSPRLSIGSSSQYLRWDGSTLNLAGNVVFNTTGSFGDAVKWVSSGVDIFSIFGSMSGITLKGSSHIYLQLGDSIGGKAFYVVDSGGQARFGVASNGGLLVDVNNAVVDTNTPGPTFRAMPLFTTTGSLWGYIPVYSGLW